MSEEFGRNNTNHSKTFALPPTVVAGYNIIIINSYRAVDVSKQGRACLSFDILGLSAVTMGTSNGTTCTRVACTRVGYKNKMIIIICRSLIQHRSCTIINNISEHLLTLNIYSKCMYRDILGILRHG